MANAAPPDAETLRKFALGDLTQAEWDRVARHLESHPQGPETLAELGTDDTFVSALRAGVQLSAFRLDLSLGPLLG